MASTADFIIKDSGEREDFPTGARRDTQTGKPRYDLIPSLALKRIAIHYSKGCEKYGERNFEKGINNSRCLASLERHLHEFKLGDTTEDHLSALAFNVITIIFNQEAIKLGILPKELDDLPDYTQRNTNET